MQAGYLGSGALCFLMIISATSLQAQTKTTETADPVKVTKTVLSSPITTPLPVQAVKPTAVLPKAKAGSKNPTLFPVGGDTDAVLLDPSSDQTITQPDGTTLYIAGSGLLSVQNSILVGNGQGTVTSGGGGDIWIQSGESGTITLDTTINQPQQPASVSVLLTSGGQGGQGSTGGTFFVQDSDSSSIFFCGATGNDWVGVGSPNACGAYDIFDVSNREAFGDGYMHWYLDGSGGVQNAGISNPSAGVLSFDTGVDGNAAATLKAGGIQFPDGIQTHAYIPGSGPSGPITSVGTITSGVWQGTPIAAPYLPSDVMYTDTAQTISGAKSFSASIGLGTTTPNTWSAVSAPGANLQLYGAGTNARLIINSTNNDGAELHLVDGAAGTDHHNHRLYADSGGLALDQPTDNYGSSQLNMFWANNGNVGIGTSTPGAGLEVNGSIKLTTGSAASITFADSTVQTTAWRGVLTGGDYAEAVDVQGDRAEYVPGDIIVIDPASPGAFTKSQTAYSRLVAGVFSTKPGLVGRRATAPRPDEKDEVPMAMMGIVPAKVSTENGPIEPGDLLVSASTPGYAMKGTDSSRLMGAVIGKALAPLSEGSGTIEVLISLQ